MQRPYVVMGDSLEAVDSSSWIDVIGCLHFVST